MPGTPIDITDTDFEIKGLDKKTLEKALNTYAEAQWKVAKKHYAEESLLLKEFSKSKEAKDILTKAKQFFINQARATAANGINSILLDLGISEEVYAGNKTVFEPFINTLVFGILESANQKWVTKVMPVITDLLIEKEKIALAVEVKKLENIHARYTAIADLEIAQSVVPLINKYQVEQSEVAQVDAKSAGAKGYDKVKKTYDALSQQIRALKQKETLSQEENEQLASLDKAIKQLKETFFGRLAALVSEYELRFAGNKSYEFPQTIRDRLHGALSDRLKREIPSIAHSPLQLGSDQIFSEKDRNAVPVAHSNLTVHSQQHESRITVAHLATEKDYTDMDELQAVQEIFHEQLGKTAVTKIGKGSKLGSFKIEIHSAAKSSLFDVLDSVEKAKNAIGKAVKDTQKKQFTEFSKKPLPTMALAATKTKSYGSYSIGHKSSDHVLHQFKEFTEEKVASVKHKPKQRSASDEAVNTPRVSPVNSMAQNDNNNVRVLEEAKQVKNEISPKLMEKRQSYRELFAQQPASPKTIRYTTTTKSNLRGLALEGYQASGSGRNYY